MARQIVNMITMIIIITNIITITFSLLMAWQIVHIITMIIIMIIIKHHHHYLFSVDGLADCEEENEKEAAALQVHPARDHPEKKEK